MKRAMIIVNPSSGKERAIHYLHKVESVLKEQGYECITNKTEKELDATQFSESACAEKYDLIVSIGGDGTLNETVNGLAGQEHRPMLAIIPMGTMNDIARALNIPLNPDEAIDVLKNTRTHKVDLGKVNDRYFMNIIAVGAIAEATANVTVEQKTKLGPFAYFTEGVKAFSEKLLYDFELYYDQKKWHGKGWHMLISLTNSVGGFEKFSPMAEVDDGKLHCFIIKDISLGKVPTLATALLRGELREQEDVEYFTAATLTLSSSDNLVANIDGETGNKLPIQLEVLPKRIEVLVPS